MSREQGAISTSNLRVEQFVSGQRQQKLKHNTKENLLLVKFAVGVCTRYSYSALSLILDQVCMYRISINANIRT